MNMTGQLPCKPDHRAATEAEKRVRTIANKGMTCLSLKDIWTTPATDPNPFHKRIIDPDTGKLEWISTLCARKVVAYLGHRCNHEIGGNEADLDEYTQNGLQIHHMVWKTYVESVGQNL